MNISIIIDKSIKEKYLEGNVTAIPVSNYRGYYERDYPVGNNRKELEESFERNHILFGKTAKKFEKHFGKCAFKTGNEL